MKTFLGELIATIFICIIFWPWAIGIVDAAIWAIIGEQFTSIPWGSKRGAFLVMWPFMWLCVILLFGMG
jgi:hypothetical protein